MEHAIITHEKPLGNIIDPVKINDAFRNYYEKLYSSDCSLNKEQQIQSLDDLNLPQISEEDQMNLDEGYL